MKRIVEIIFYFYEKYFSTIKKYLIRMMQQMP